MKTGAYADLSFEFLFAKLHGMWSKAIAGPALKSLIESHADSALSRVLSGRGIEPRDRSRVQKGLLAHLLRVLGGVMQLTGPEVGAFYRRLIDRFYVENLKTILHYRYFPERDVAVEILLIDSPFLPGLDAPVLLEATTVHRFFQLLPENELRTRLLPILVELDDSHDLFVAEARLDQLYFQGLTRHLADLPGEIRDAARELITTEVDISNIVILLRNAALYDLSPDRVTGLSLPGGARLGRAAIRNLAGVGSPAAIRDGLPPIYRQCLEGLDPDTLHLWENALWNLLYRRAYHWFRDFDQTGASLAAFPFLERFEALNIGRVFEGFHFKLDTADILSMMIGL